MYWSRLVQKGYSLPKLTCHSTITMLIYALMLLNLLQTYHFQANPVIHGPNPYLDPLSPLYVIVRPRNLFQSIARNRFSRKCAPHWVDRFVSNRFRVMAVWNLSPDSREARDPLPPRHPLPRLPPPHGQTLYIQVPLRLCSVGKKTLVCEVVSLRYSAETLNSDISSY